MTEHAKIELPRFMCEWLTGFCTQQPLSYISEINRKRNRGDIDTEVFKWLNYNEANQWKLIDALRYGYDPEPEQRWGIKAGNCYMDDPVDLSFTALIDEAYTFIGERSVENKVAILGFGEVVDLNKETTDD